MPWKDRYTISDECGMADHQVRWPGNAACCFRIVVDVSPPCGPEGLTAASVSTPEAQYGLHGGLLALRQVFLGSELHATFVVPAVLAEPLADTLSELKREGHEIAAHGYLREDVSLLSYEE
jgi:hypothetical protein